MWFRHFRVVFAVVVVVVPVLVMWWSISILNQARYVTFSDETLRHAFSTGNAIPILVIPGIFIFLSVIHELKIIINAQKTQIDDLKSELEEVKGKE